MSKLIRVSRKIYNYLKSKKAFRSESFDNVLKRELSLSPRAAAEEAKQKKEKRRGGLLNEREIF